MVLIDGGLICSTVNQKHCFRIIHREEVFVSDVACLSANFINNAAFRHFLGKCLCVAVLAGVIDIDCFYS